MIDSKRTILFSLDAPPMPGGISRFCEDLIKNWGSQITLLAGEKEKRAPAKGVVRVSGLGKKGSLFAVPYILKNRKGTDWVASRWYPEGLVLHWLGVKNRTILAHGSEFLDRPGMPRFFKDLMKKVLEESRAVVANSHYTAELVQEVAPQANILALPLGVDSKRFVPGDKAVAKKKFGVEDKFVLGTLTRLEPYKGIQDVLKALSELNPKERERITYLVAGTGPFEAGLKEVARAQGVYDNIKWLGRIEEDALVEFYQSLDLFVLCSGQDLSVGEVEGFGIVYLEAQSCAVPAMGTPSGGIPDALVKGASIMVPYGDIEAIASELKKAVADPQTLVGMGEQARQFVVSDRNWASYVQRFKAFAQPAKSSLSASDFKKAL